MGKSNFSNDLEHFIIKNKRSWDDCGVEELLLFKEEDFKSKKDNPRLRLRENKKSLKQNEEIFEEEVNNND